MSEMTLRIVSLDAETQPNSPLAECLRQIPEWQTELFVFSDARDAYDEMAKAPADLIFLDFCGSGWDGMVVLQQIQAMHPFCPVIVMTDKGSEETAVDVMQSGAADYMLKRFMSARSLKRAISNALEKYKLRSAVENHRRQLEETNLELQQALTREIEIGSSIQRELLIGRPPQDLRGFQIASLVIPAQSIGGDFCDFIAYGDLFLDLIVGDVMGKGVPAALLGAGTISEFIRAMIRLMTAASELGIPAPEAIVNAVHRKLTPQLIHLESFVTLCYCRFDLPKKKIQFVDCGHIKAVHYQSDTQSCRVLQGSNMPLGISPSEVYRAEEVNFNTGDIFLFHSDGLVETRNARGEFYGDVRLAQWVLEHSALSPAQMIEQIHADVTAYAQSNIFADDLTCVVVKIESAAQKTTMKSPMEVSSLC